MAPRRVIAILRQAGAAVLAAWVLGGCATPAIDSARYHYYAGQVDRAEAALADAKIPDKDRVLLLMERGTVRQALGAYEESSKDFIAAADLLEKLEAYSVSKNAASWVVNDNTQNFRGTPFERTLLHAFTAINHLAEGRWDDAAVEARRIIKSLSPEVKGEYPDDAFSRYMAGFCLEMIDDPSNAALQYRLASELAPHVAVDEVTGHLIPKAASTNMADLSARTSNERPWPHELVCFVLLDRAPRGYDRWSDHWRPGLPTYATLSCNGQELGRSFNLSDTVELAFTTDQLEALRKAAKSVSRVVLKEVIAGQVEQKDEALGELVRFILIGLLEQPDVRRWETLPRWLQVARVPCPPDLTSFDVQLKNAAGYTYRTIHVEKPIMRRRNTFVSFCRDLPVPRAKP